MYTMFRLLEIANIIPASICLFILHTVNCVICPNSSPLHQFKTKGQPLDGMSHNIEVSLWPRACWLCPLLLPTLLRETARTLSLTHQNRCSLGALFHSHYHRVKACRDEAVQRLSPAGFDWAKIRSSLEKRVILFPDFDLLWSLNRF